MEADWEFEISADAPVIDAHWAGFVDIRAHPEFAASLPEVAHFQTLAETLIHLNSEGSPVWTSKCDFWSVNPEEYRLDADELDAPPGMLAAATACYIDLLARLEQWENPDLLAQDCATLCARLHSIQLRCCRADFVIRKAILAAEEERFGITAYFTACGSSEETSKTALAQALHVFADTALAVWIR